MGPLTLPPDVWDDPDVVAAVEAGDLGRFLLAARGARRARISQDNAARLIGCAQATVSRLENGKIPATDVSAMRLQDAVLTGLGVPLELRRRWGR